MAVSTADEYLSALEKSKLLGSEQFVEAQRLAGESSDAAALARALVRENLVSRWQAGTLLALGPRAQLRLGKYKLIQKLGKGGMGMVFLAEHVTMNRRVALKIVPRAIAEDRALLSRFFAEASAIAALDHPNIVQAYSVDNEMDRYFIVMEFVDGQDLQRIVEDRMAAGKGPMEFDCAADYVRQAAEGLSHAHARNLVHCDIKPSNLLVNNRGVIKILDLGLARLNRSDEPRGAAAGEPAFGTVDYMAPEQGLETANFDHRADIYSLGCTLYFLLTGHPPFPEGTLAQRIVKHQTQEPRDILLDRPDTPAMFVEICKRMMAKEPENRYQTMQEVSAALAPLQRGADGAAGGRDPGIPGAPQAVKPLEESAPADDWLSSLATPAKTVANSNGAKTPASTSKTGKPAKSGKQPGKKGGSSGGIAAGLAGLLTFGRAKLGWFNTPKRIILGAAGGAALLAAVAGLAALPFLLSPPKPPPQASVQEPAGPPPDKSTASKDSAEKRGPEKDVSEGETEVPKKPKSHKTTPKVVEPPPAEPEKPVPKPSSKPTVAAATAPAVAVTPKPSVKPATPDKKPEPPKAVSLDGLEKEVDLPLLGKAANNVVPLGKLDVDPKLALNVQLLGGETVAKSKSKFTLEKDGDNATAGWSVQMAGKGKEPAKIARVWREGSEWKFQWAVDTKDKTTLDRATLLRYCGLQFSCEKKTHLIALCKPETVAPLAIDLDGGSGRRKLSREFPLPDITVLRLQILPLDKALPKNEIKVLENKPHGGRASRGQSAEAVAGGGVPVKGRGLVVLTKEKTPRVGFYITFDVRGKDVLLEMQGICEISGRKVPFNRAGLQEVNAFLTAMENSQKGPRKPTAEQTQALKMAKDDLQALADLAVELNQKASIPFCVYVVLGDTDDATSPKVVIFQSGQVEEAKAGGAKKNPKGKQPKGRSSAEKEELKF